MKEKIEQKERKIIQELASEVKEIAEKPVMQKRKEMWTKHNSLQGVRPMLLVFPEGSWRELLPESRLQCTNELAREIEWELRRRIFKHRHINDDNPIEDTYIVNKEIENTGWGVNIQHVESSQDNGAWGFDPVIEEPEDLNKLHYPQIEYKKEKTQKKLKIVKDLLGDILEVKLKGINHISFHLMNLYCKMRGLEQVMWDMYDNPDMLHQAMSFLETGHKKMLEQYRELNLLSLNNDGTYHSSGGVGYTDELPQDDFEGEVRPQDMWASAEAQEMAQVSPEMHSEFILPYEKRLLEPFGLNGYGCCEDLTYKLEDVFTISNIRRISISPWADVEKSAEKLQDNYIFSWKPNPAYIAGEFNPKEVEKYIKNTLEVTEDCVLEIILKDTHTCENEPERFTSWVEIARDLIGKFA